MIPNKRYQFLFAVAMFGGNMTYFRSLQDAVGAMEDVEPTWLPIEAAIPDIIAKIPPFSLNWTLRGSTVTKLRINALERKGKKFDAALFHHQMLTLMLSEFSQRVPYVISTGATPLQHDTYEYWYAKKRIPFERVLHTVKQIPTRRAYEKAQYILPLSDWANTSIVRDYHIRNDKVITIPPGVNLEHWVRPRMKRVSSHAPQILFVGGEFMRKGGDMLTAIAQQEEFSRYEFHFVTDSYVGPTAPNIFVHTNVTPNSDYLLALYAQADIFILPTRADFSSWAIVEAMSQRLPVIATDSGGIKELVRDGVTGFIVPIDDHASLQQRIRQLIADPPLRERFGDAARALVEERFDQRKNVCRLINYMKSIADKG